MAGPLNLAARDLDILAEIIAEIIARPAPVLRPQNVNGIVFDQPLGPQSAITAPPCSGHPPGTR